MSDDQATAVEPRAAAADLRLYATYAAGGLLTLTLLGVAVDCVQSWRSRRRRRARALVLGRPAAARLREMLMLKADEHTADREETLWFRIFGATDAGGSGLCDVDEWMLAMRQLVPIAEDTSGPELESIFDAIDADGHGLLTPQSLGAFVWAMEQRAQSSSDGRLGATLLLLAAVAAPPALRATQVFSWHEIVWLCCAVFIAFLTLGGGDDGVSGVSGFVREWLRAEGASLRAVLGGAANRRPSLDTHPRRSSAERDAERDRAKVARSSRARIIPPPRREDNGVRNRDAIKLGGSTSLSRGLGRSPNAAAIHEGKRRLVQGLRDISYSETRGVQDLDTLYHKLDCEGLLAGTSSLLGVSFCLLQLVVPSMLLCCHRHASPLPIPSRQRQVATASFPSASS